MSASSKPVPLALPHDLIAQIAFVAEQLGMSRQDTMRLSMRIGLEDLKRIDYRVDKSVVDSAAEVFSQTPRRLLAAAASLLAEEPASYGASAAPKKRAS